MRIAFILDDAIDRPGGVQTYILAVTWWLAGQGHEVELVAAGEIPRGYPVTHHRIPNMPTMRINGTDIGIAVPVGLGDFMRRLREGYFDVLHLQFPQSFAISRRAMRQTHPRTSIVASYHTVPYTRLDRLALMALARSLRRYTSKVDLFLPTSKIAHHWLATAFAVGGPILPPALAMGPWTADRHLDESRPIVFLGRLAPRKGCDILIKAYASLAREGGVKLPPMHIIGRGSSERKLRALVARLGLSGQIDFLGLVSESVKLKLLASAGLAVYPSLGGEGFGYVLVEALSLGVPVIAGNIEAYAETLAGAPGVLVDARAPEAVAEAIKALLSSCRADRCTEIRESRAHAAKFDIKLIGPMLLEHYAAIVSSRQRT
jgi:phosphatidylinositol alpha-mannosyltransferase